GIRDYKVTGVQTCALPIWPFAEGGVRPLASATLGRHCLAPPVLPCQPAGRQRGGGHHTHAEALAQRQHVRLDAPSEDGVRQLLDAWPFSPPLFRYPLRIDDHVTGKAGRANSADLALVHEIAHGAERLVEV